MRWYYKVWLGLLIVSALFEGLSFYWAGGLVYSNNYYQLWNWGQSVLSVAVGWSVVVALLGLRNLLIKRGLR
jgi:hypothetical protein